MTDLTWRQQAEAAFSSAMDSTGRVTGSREAMTATALRAALDVAEQAIKADRVVSAVFACKTEDCPRPFALWQDGENARAVAYGARFADGMTALLTFGGVAERTSWHWSLESAVRFREQPSRPLRVVWLAAEFSEMALAEQEAAAAERKRIRDLATEHRAVCAVDPDAALTAPMLFADLIGDDL